MSAFTDSGHSGDYRNEISNVSLRPKAVIEIGAECQPTPRVSATPHHRALVSTVEYSSGYGRQNLI